MAQRKLDVHDIYLTRDAYGFQLSPDRSHWIWIDQVGETVEEEAGHESRGNRIVTSQADLVIMPVQGGYPQPLGVSHLPLSRPQWSPDGGQVAFGGRDGVWVVSVESGFAQQIEREPVYQLDLAEVNTPIRQLRGDSLWADVLWSPDGKHIFYISEEDGTQHFWLVRADGSARKRIHSVDGQIVSRQWSPDGCHILFTRRNWDGTTSSIWTVDVQTEQRTLLLEEESSHYLRLLATWAPAGDSVIFRSNRSGYAKLWTMAPDGSAMRQLSFGEYDDSLLRVMPDGETLAFASRADQLGGEDIWLVSLNGGTPRRLTTHPGLNRPLAWGEDGKVLYYFHTSPTEPGDLWCINLEDQTPQQLTRTRYPWLHEQLAWPEELQVAGEAHDIYSLLYKPLNFDPNHTYPAVLWIKGGPTTSSRVAYQPAPRWLANQGYLVVYPNYRGSIGFGVDYMNAGARGNAGQTDLEDIVEVTSYVKSLPYVDSERVGITGRSWGGYMTLMCVTHYPDLFRVAVAHAAIYNWLIQQAEEDVRHYSHWLYDGWSNEKPQFYSDRSPITRVEHIKTPLLVTHGTADVNVPFVQVDTFIKKARAAGVEVESHFYNAEGHSNKRLANRKDYLARTVQFLDKHLKRWDFRGNPRRGQRLE